MPLLQHPPFQILVYGSFNGDPHPGNSKYPLETRTLPQIELASNNAPFFFSHSVMLLGVEEGNPQLGLIDYGQVKVLTREERLLFCKLIIALADDNKEQICSLMKEAGYKSKYMDPQMMYTFARVGYDEDNMTLTEGKHIQVYMEHLHDSDPVDQIPQQYIMASRVSILLRGLGHAVHQSRSVAKAWRPIAVKALEDAERNVPSVK